MYVLSQILKMETVEYTNPIKMAEILHKKTAYTAAYTNFISILYHCLLIPSEQIIDIFIMHDIAQ